MKDPEKVFTGTVTAHVTADDNEKEIYKSASVNIQMSALQDRWDGKLQIPVNNTVPGTLKLHLNLRGENGKVLNTNTYSLWILDAAVPVIDQQKKATGFIGDLKAALRISNTFTWKMIKTPTDLTTIDRLIILPETWKSVSSTLKHSLAPWIKSGGRLLILEQTSEDHFEPFGLKLSSELDTCNNFSEIIVPDHPIWRGLSPQLFRDFAEKNNLVVKSGYQPLSTNTLMASGPNGTVYDARYGQGEIIVSLVQAFNCLDQDSVANRYFSNMLDYLINQPIWKDIQEAQIADKPFELSPDLKWKNISLASVANRRTSDQQAGEAGFLDLGSLDLRHAPTGDISFYDIPFNILPPKQTNIVILQGQRNPQLPLETGPIPVNAPAKYLAFLHTAYSCQPGLVLTYKILYTDGSSVNIPIAGEREIGDWYEPKDLPNALAVWSKPHPKVNAKLGFFMYVWKNPKPEVVIKEIRIESAQTAVPIVLAVSVGN
jgi:beta-galactosidase